MEVLISLIAVTLLVVGSAMLAGNFVAKAAIMYMQKRYLKTIIYSMGAIFTVVIFGVWVVM